MYKTQLDGGNVVYHSKPFDNLRNQIKFHNATNCTVYVAAKADLEVAVINCYGCNAAVFIGNSRLGKLEAHVYECGCLYIGDSVFINPYGGTQPLRCAGRANVIVGNGCFISTSVEITTTDVHLIYDKESRNRINQEASIFIGDHVWLSREVKVFKNARISSGCICGARALVSGTKAPANSLIAGVPGRIKKQGNVVWLRPSSYFFSDEDIERYEHLSADNPFYLDACYAPEEREMISPADIDATLKSLKSSEQKISFLYDTLFQNVKHNRFVWDLVNAETNGQVLKYNDTFSSLKFEAGTTEVLCKPVVSEIRNDELLNLICEKYIKQKFLYYRFMSHLCFWHKKNHYVSKKRRFKQLLKEIRKTRMSVMFRKFKISI